MVRYVRRCSDTGVVFWLQAAPRQFPVQSDTDWAGNKSTRKSVSAGNIRYGQHVLRVIAVSSGEAQLFAAYMATQQAMGTESMARELGVRLDVMELQVGANEAVAIIGRQGLG